MNIAVGKIGKSVLFEPSKWGAIGGDNEAPILFEKLFHNNPDKTFYLVGRSDFSTLDAGVQNRINKHGNVIDIWKDLKQFKQSHTGEKKSQEIDYMYEYLSKSTIKFNSGLFFAGPVSTSTVYGKSRLISDPTQFAKPLDMTCKYAAPVIIFLNETKIPWNIIINDPRFFPSSIRDLFNLPKKGLSQYTETIETKRWTTYEDQTLIHQKVPSEYAMMETIFLIDKERGNFETNTSSLDAFFGDEPSNEKDINFMVVCNEGRPSRYPDLKKYILDKVEDIEIYGKWDERTIGDDSRFKGSKKFQDLQAMLPRVKYTFCIPIKKNWVTAKFWEMAHYGIIPFLHPTYDTQNNLKCPEYLRVKNASDLFDKIKHLEENPEHYQILRDKLDKMIKDEFYNGSYLNNIIMNSMKEIAV